MEKQQVRRIKPYKEVSPLKTINRIRSILNKLDIFTIESHVVDESDFHSCHITMDNYSMAPLGIATNGKGMTREFSLASGYAEFLERIQNNAKTHLQNYQATKRFIDRNNVNGAFKKRLDEEGLLQEFRFAPDEEFITPEETVNTHEYIYNQLFNLDRSTDSLQFMNEELGIDTVEVLPFYHVNTNAVVKMPIRLIQLATGTNGMCSGNTKIEAILQGISEVFERYAIREIYQRELTPPTIPLETFEGNEIYDRIKKLGENKPYTFIIKDCSLGIGLPVLGALIIDHQMNTYTFHLGADPSPVTALERCFTEVYQGGRTPRFKPLPILFDDIFDNLNKQNGKSREWNKLNQMYKTIKDGTGYWPESIFQEKGSYAFNGFENPVSMSNEKDLEYILSIIYRNHFNLLIRDQSFLDFDSFFIYIPEMSHLYNIPDNEVFKIDYGLKKNFTVLSNLNHSDGESIEKVAMLIEKDYNHPGYCEKNIRGYFLANMNYDFVNMQPELLLVMLFYRNKNYEKALQYLRIHLENRKTDKNLDFTYLYCVAEFLRLKTQNASDEAIQKTLHTLFKKTIAHQVLHDMADPKKIFQYHKMPHCFDCENCVAKDYCRFFDLLRCYKPIRDRHNKNVIDQLALTKLFLQVADKKIKSDTNPV